MTMTVAMAAATTLNWAEATIPHQLLHQLLLVEEDISSAPTTATTTTKTPALPQLLPLQLGVTFLLPPQLLPQVSGLHL